jgi:hypothetical protein
MFDLGALSASAILAAAQHFGQKAADGAAGNLGTKVVDWLKRKLTEPHEKTAFDKLTANPGSEGARRTLEGAVLSRLEQEPALVQDLASLLKEAGGATMLNQYVAGDHNKTSQIAGSGNTVLISDRQQDDRGADRKS